MIRIKKILPEYFKNLFIKPPEPYDFHAILDNNFFVQSMVGSGSEFLLYSYLGSGSVSLAKTTFLWLYTTENFHNDPAASQEFCMRYAGFTDGTRTFPMWTLTYSAVGEFQNSVYTARKLILMLWCESRSTRSRDPYRPIVDPLGHRILGKSCGSGSIWANWGFARIPHAWKSYGSGSIRANWGFARTPHSWKSYGAGSIWGDCRWKSLFWGKKVTCVSTV